MTICEIINFGSKQLKDRKEAEEILCYLLKKNKVEIVLDYNKPINQSKIKRYKKLINRRKNGEPLDYIIKKSCFMGCEFIIKKGVFIPRQETEILVEKVIEKIKNVRCKNIMTVDLGCGCGNIAISLAKKIDKIKIFASDISNEAVDLAIQNAKNNGVEKKIIFLKGDLLKPLMKYNLKEKIYFFIFNAPYIKTKELTKLPKEISYEPKCALNGGKDGLFFYKKILPDAVKLLKKGGYLVFELGKSQEREISKLFSEYNLVPNIFKDYSGKSRVIMGEKV